VRLTERHGAVLDVIVGVRTLDDLREFRSLNPNLRTLGFVSSLEDIDPFLAAGVDIVRLWPEWIEADPDAVQEIHRRGRAVWTTAGDAPGERLARLVALGVNGVLTDHPDVMARVLAEREAAR
jgi:glycerophosphoryl diester phosphodiesterase